MNNNEKTKKGQVISKLSVIVAPNRSGDIIVREGQDDERNLEHLAKNFIVCYGLKKDMYSLIF